MPVSAKFLSSDFSISGAFKPIDNAEQQAKVATQLYWDKDR
jgi:hypothetical protein